MEDSRKATWILLVWSGLFAVLVAMDLVNDYQSGSTLRHLSIEGLLLLLSGGVFAMGLRKLRSVRQEVTVLKGDLDRIRNEKERWKQETHQLLAGLSQKIEDQFTQWELTPAEKEVGFLLLKGISLKEIADIRQTRLKTVQQQSQSIYQKTGLASRSELAAFFLEDLLPGTGESPQIS
ncbi:MAG: LuxR C-terminal-related transcriptional regulator [Nitrospinota bacterium]|nr:LuxR C-terminal-related transcriptional regulator [Nitrospinota bacterium]